LSQRVGEKRLANDPVEGKLWADNKFWRLEMTPLGLGKLPIKGKRVTDKSKLSRGKKGRAKKAQKSERVRP